MSADSNNGEAGAADILDLLNAALEHHRFERFEQAAEGFFKVLQAEPREIKALYGLGMSLHRLDENEKAVEFVKDALERGYGGAQEHCNLGIIYLQLDRLDEAVECYKRAIALDGNFVAGYFNLGNAYRDLKKPDDAIEALHAAVTLKPDFPQAWNNLGLAMHDAGRFEEALECYNNALNGKPDYAAAYLNMGNALGQMGRPDAAAVSFQKAIVLDRTLFEAHNNLGNVLKDLERFEAAAACYEKVIQAEPENFGAHKNLGIVRLVQGDFEGGWPEYSWRRRDPDDPVFRVRAYKQPLWDGEDLTGKTILAYPEQGLGDTLQFVRYLPMLRQTGAHVIFDAPLPMARLFKDLDGVDTMLQSGDTIPPFDFHISLMELPRLFHTTLETIPAGGAYLKADDGLIGDWAERLGQKQDPKQGLRVGFVWGGNPDHANDRNRSIDPELFTPLVEAPGVEAFSLLVGRDGEAEHVFGDAIRDLAPQLTDFSETAAAIANLDVVISVDTSVVHLAGALGARVWTLLPFNPDWRWMMEGDASPWYPTMRLYRQARKKTWESVLEPVAEDLAELGGNTG
ncbi:MAG: glycosyltransferase family protein [Rhodospirillales bacterium]|nr:glycosyltransferase family protein [Rhodospirillales bacterium]